MAAKKASIINNCNLNWTPIISLLGFTPCLSTRYLNTFTERDEDNSQFEGNCAVVIGTLSVLLFSPDRIPIIIEVETYLTIPGIKEVLLEIFPRNFFLVFINNGNFLLPLFFLAFFLGLNFSFDKVETRPVKSSGSS